MSSKKGKAVFYLGIGFAVILVFNIALLMTIRFNAGTDSGLKMFSGISVSKSDYNAAIEYIDAVTFDMSAQVINEAKTEPEDSAAANSNTKPRKNIGSSEVNRNTVYKYMITVYLKSQSVVVYRREADGKQGEEVTRFVCSSGLSSSSTPVGRFNLIRRFRWRLLQGGVYGQYATTITGNILFHSVPFLRKDPSSLKNAEYDKLGTRASMGCIRLCVRDCKWIYDNAPNGTQVTIVNQEGPAGYAPPKRNTDPLYAGWDPTDRWSEGNPYFRKNDVTETTSNSSTTASSTIPDSTTVSSTTLSSSTNKSSPTSMTTAPTSRTTTPSSSASATSSVTSASSETSTPTGASSSTEASSATVTSASGAEISSSPDGDPE